MEDSLKDAREFFDLSSSENYGIANEDRGMNNRLNKFLQGFQDQDPY
jgi:hypothetical protein